MIICYLIRGHDGPIDLCSFVRYTPRFDSFLQQIKENILGQLVRATLIVMAATSSLIRPLDCHMFTDQEKNRVFINFLIPTGKLFFDEKSLLNPNTTPIL